MHTAGALHPFGLELGVDLIQGSGSSALRLNAPDGGGRTRSRDRYLALQSKICGVSHARFSSHVARESIIVIFANRARPTSHEVRAPAHTLDFSEAGQRVHAPDKVRFILPYTLR
jgi:hypothetical protein